MIEPTKITNYSRSKAELQMFLLFCITVAGKNSDVAAKAINQMFSCHEARTNPFDYIKSLVLFGGIGAELRKHKTGNYTRLARGFHEASDLDVFNCTVEDLVKVHGIGPKTARMFLLHSRQGQRVVPLDVHILKWLRFLGHKTPKNTPVLERVYADWEKIALEEIDKHFGGVTIAQADLLIWKAMSGRS